MEGERPVVKGTPDQLRVNVREWTSNVDVPARTDTISNSGLRITLEGTIRFRPVESPDTSASRSLACHPLRGSSAVFFAIEVMMPPLKGGA